MEESFGLLDKLTSSSGDSDPSATLTVLRRHLRSISVIFGVVSACLANGSKPRTGKTEADGKREMGEPCEETSRLKLWVSDSIISAVVKIYLNIFSLCIEGRMGSHLEVRNFFFGLVI